MQVMNNYNKKIVFLLTKVIQMYFKGTLVIIFCLFVVPQIAKGQDVVYSQYYGNPVYLNPSLVGNKINPRLSLIYRNQWHNLNKGYVNYGISYDQYVRKMSGSVGVILNNDVYGGGLCNNFSGSIIYAFQTYVFKDFTASIALQSGFFQRSINTDKLVFGDQIVPGSGQLLPTNEVVDRDKVSDLDFAAGITIGYKHDYYVGFALHHLANPDISFIGNDAHKLDTRITVHAGAIFDVGYYKTYPAAGSKSISPNILFVKQGDFMQLSLGTYFNVYPLTVGLWGRHCFNNFDALVVQIGVEQKKYKIGYSFDFTLSKLSINSGGAHEISFSWIFPEIKNNFNRYTINDPVY